MGTMTSMQNGAAARHRVHSSSHHPALFEKVPYFETPGFLVRRIHQIHVATFLEECAEFDVTPVQFSVLKVLSGAETDQGSIATQIGVDRTTTAGVLRRLRARRLVICRSDAGDLRSKLWRLSSAGERLTRDMAANASRSHERVVACLTRPELRLYMSFLRRLVDASNELGRAPLDLR